MGANGALMKRNAIAHEAAKETRVQIWELRIAGRSIGQIAKQMGLAKSTVHQHLKNTVRELEDEIREHALDWTHLLIGRTERIAGLQYQTAMGLIKDGEGEDAPKPSLELRLQAARDLLRTIESTRKMMGLDAPERHEVASVSAVELRELSGPDLAREVGGLLSGMRTMDPGALERALEGDAREVAPNGRGEIPERSPVPDVPTSNSQGGSDGDGDEQPGTDDETRDS